MIKNLVNSILPYDSLFENLSLDVISNVVNIDLNNLANSISLKSVKYEKKLSINLNLILGDIFCLMHNQYYTYN